MNKTGKKRILGLLAVSIMMMLAGCTIKVQQSSEYGSPGRNTKEWFGNGRFEIFSGYSAIDDNRYYCLYDRKDYNGSIENRILVYKVYDTDIYVIGLEGHLGTTEAYDKDYFTLDKMPETIVYTKVNYESEEVWQSEDITDFGEEDQDIFEELLNSKTLYEY